MARVTLAHPSAGAQPRMHLESQTAQPMKGHSARNYWKKWGTGPKVLVLWLGLAKFQLSSYGRGED